MQAAYGSEETVPVFSEAEGNESDYTVKESHEAYSDKESQASRAEDEQVVVATCWHELALFPSLHSLYLSTCMQVDSLNL